MYHGSFFDNNSLSYYKYSIKKLTESSPKMPRKEITENLIRRIAGHIRKGNYVEVACAAEGVFTNQYYNWMKRGDADYNEGNETLYADFYQTVTRAAAKAEIQILSDWKAAPANLWAKYATILQRSRPTRWGDKVQIEQDIKVQGLALPPPPKTHEEWLKRRLERSKVAVIDAEYKEVGGDGDANPTIHLTGGDAQQQPVREASQEIDQEGSEGGES